MITSSDFLPGSTSRTPTLPTSSSPPVLPTASRSPTARTLTDSAQLYVCTDARIRERDFSDFVEAAYSGGVDIIQLRDKTLAAAEELEILAVLQEAAARHGRLWAVNDRVDIAVLAGAPVVHVGQADVPLRLARRMLADDIVTGLSTHSVDQITDAITDPKVDYFCVGPVWATPTKPGRAAVGCERVRYASEENLRHKSAKPWFAIGGIDRTNVEQVVAAGAQRIVVVRAITQADDPTSAARELRAAMPPLAVLSPMGAGFALG